VGENRPIPVDVRLIAATHQDLQALMAQGRFRQDFYFRVNALPIEMPPLRDRMEDLPRLAAHFLHKAAARAGGQPPALTPDALRVLAAHAWPGNVRELKHALEYSCVLSEDGRIGPEHLPPGVGNSRPARDAPAPEAGRRCALPAEPPRGGAPSRERDELVDALNRAGGNKSQAARLLGVTRLTVHNRMRKYGVECPRVVACRIAPGPCQNPCEHL